MSGVTPYVACSSISNGGSIKVYDARNLSPVTSCSVSPSFGMFPTSSDDGVTINSICSFPPTTLTSRSSGFTVALSLSNGKCGRLSINLPNKTQQAVNARVSSASVEATQGYLFSYHQGAVFNVASLRIGEKFRFVHTKYILAVYVCFLFLFANVFVFRAAASPLLGRQIAASVGEDRSLFLWDVANRISIGCGTLEDSGICCDFDRSGLYIVAGLVNGAISLFSINSRVTGPTGRPSSRDSCRVAGGSSGSAGSALISVDLVQVAFRKDRKTHISDVKFRYSFIVYSLIYVMTLFEVFFISSSSIIVQIIRRSLWALMTIASAYTPCCSVLVVQSCP